MYRLRFTTKSLLAMMGLISLLFGIAAHIGHKQWNDRRAAREILLHGGAVGHTGLWGSARVFLWRDEEWLHGVQGIRLNNPSLDDEGLRQLDLARFDQVERLWLGYDALYGPDGPKWERFPASISDAGLASLPNLPNLKALELRRVAIGDRGLRDIHRKFPKLERIDLAGTNITDLSLIELSKLSELRNINLDGTNITDAGLVHLAKLSQLESLSLDLTPLSGTGLAHFAGHDQLESLSLNETAIDDSNLRHLGILNRLRYLDLSQTCVSDAGMAELRHVLSLIRLEINYTLVSDAGLAHLIEIPSLMEVEAYRSNITRTGAENFVGGREDRRITITDAIYQLKGGQVLRMAFAD